MQPAGLHVVRHHAEAAGPPVVLVHGAPDRSNTFNRVVELLDDLPVTVYDRRGYGKSVAAGAEGLGFDVHVDDLIAILDGTPSVVIGHSAGCGIAMLTATRAPELFLGLGVWEPPMTAWDWSLPHLRDLAKKMGRSSDPEGTAESFNRMILGDARWEQLPEETRNQLRAEGAAFCADMASQDSRYLELDQLRLVPMLVGCGDYTEVVPIHARTAREAGSEFLVIKGASHFAPVTEPNLWAQFVRATVELAARPNE